MLIFPQPSQNLFNYFLLPNPLPENVTNDIFKISSDIEYSDVSVKTLSKEENKMQRRSKVKWIHLNDSTVDLYFFLENYIKIANQEYYNFDISYTDDSLQYTEYYETNKGYYNWHVDQIPPFQHNRKLSLVIQLSDPNEYEGGELQIKDYNGNEDKNIFTIPKQKGLVTVFPSYLWHRVTPVTKGIRKSLVWWVGGAPFR